jgi:hypothetical protein
MSGRATSLAISRALAMLLSLGGERHRVADIARTTARK